MKPCVMMIRGDKNVATPIPSTFFIAIELIGKLVEHDRKVFPWVFLDLEVLSPAVTVLIELTRSMTGPVILDFLRVGRVRPDEALGRLLHVPPVSVSAEFDGDAFLSAAD